MSMNPDDPRPNEPQSAQPVQPAAHETASQPTVPQPTESQPTESQPAVHQEVAHQGSPYQDQGPQAQGPQVHGHETVGHQVASYQPQPAPYQSQPASYQTSHPTQHPAPHQSPQYAATAAQGSGAVPPAFGGESARPAAEAEAPRQRNGGLVTGLIVGALIGGLVGGGTAAVVAHNAGGEPVVQAQSGQSLTLNNLDSATAITGVAAVATPSVVTLQVSGASASGSGSGVIYSEDGYILTNAHVATLEGSTANPSIRVQTSDGTLYDGTLVGSDPFADLAVVKIEAEGLTPITVGDSEDINVGDLAVAIGAPLNLSNTVTSGVVSALHRGISVASSMVTEDDSEPDTRQESPFPWFQFETPNQQQQQGSTSSGRVAIPVIQTDASINPGNSGGALLNANGELIGINVALASATATTGAAGSDGLGFAVPANLATRVADALIAGEQPSHGLLGVTQTNESSTEYQAGGVIGAVNPGSPAEAAGLRAGDVVTSVDGKLADSFTTVTALVRMHAGGEEITIGYNRNGEQREATVVLDTLEW